MLGLKHELEIWFLTSMGLLITSSTLLVAWLRARERAARAEAFLQGLRAQAPRVDAVAPALDAIAIEVERIGEGQRFLTRALTEPARADATKRGVSITPH
jgi:type II secretory pathway component PulM